MDDIARDTLSADLFSESVKINIVYVFSKKNSMLKMSKFINLEKPS